MRWMESDFYYSVAEEIGKFLILAALLVFFFQIFLIFTIYVLSIGKSNFQIIKIFLLEIYIRVL